MFAESELIENGYDIYLIEEYLFFSQYSFHKQKIAFHRASMKAYERYLTERGVTVVYIDAQDERSDIRLFHQEIKSQGIEDIHVINPTDYWLEIRLKDACKDIKLKLYHNLLFLNTRDELSSFFREDKRSFFQTTFYKQQRKKRAILMDEDGEPEGGKWTYDVDNRKKYPRDKVPPSIQFPSVTDVWKEAVQYTEKNFSNNPGKLSNDRLYPVNYKESQEWFHQFLTQRFFDFGIYEDAIVKENSILNHSVLSPLINVGLLSPQKVIDDSIAFAQEHEIPINSTEGFVRQIIGWREFIRGMYICKGRESRITNFWGFNRKIPKSFYEGTTGIPPIDQTIKKVLATGYCHHIERLMVLGNFMLLCEFDPDEVYRWFMELFIDAYDWVMVPNVYGMSLFADGGTFATKPYIGGSNYIRKMSNYPKGDWQQVWDGLFWRFVSVHREFFSSNPRSAMIVRNLDRMSDEKIQSHLDQAESFIARLDS